MNIANEIAIYLFEQDLGVYDEEGLDGNIFIDANVQAGQTITIYNMAEGYYDVKLGYEKQGIQIIVTGNDNPITSFVFARDVFQALINVSSSAFVSAGSTIIGCTSNQGSPECIGRDSDGNFQYSMNFLIERKV